MISVPKLFFVPEVLLHSIFLKNRGEDPNPSALRLTGAGRAAILLCIGKYNETLAEEQDARGCETL